MLLNCAYIQSLLTKYKLRKKLYSNVQLLPRIRVLVREVLKLNYLLLSQIFLTERSCIKVEKQNIKNRQLNLCMVCETW